MMKLIKEDVGVEYSDDGQSHTAHCPPVITSVGFDIYFTETEDFLFRE